MDGILSLHEIMHYTHIKKHVGIILKLDFEKAYDKSELRFLLSCHKIIGFDDKWCSWCLKFWTMVLFVLKSMMRWALIFKMLKGFARVTHFCLFFFNLAVECHTKMVVSARRNNLIQGHAPDLIDNGVENIHYADDIVLCIMYDPRPLRKKDLNIKLILYIFSDDVEVKDKLYEE